MPTPQGSATDFDDLDRRHREVLDRLEELEQRIESALDQFTPRQETR